jgi:prepilin-type N-terminal cleavage/methylation domain-containing protein
MNSADSALMNRKARLAVPSVENNRGDGFTLIEVVIAIAVGAIISLAVVSSIAQVIDGSARSSNRMTAMRQVQNAGYWVSRDAAMAQNTTTSPDFLTFMWTGWDNRVTRVRYVLEDAPGGLKNLRREQQVDDYVIGSTLVGQYVDASRTSVTFAPGDMTFTVTSKVGVGAKVSTETRVYQVKPRPGT